MNKTDVILEKENNNYFRKWIIEEWKHHNTKNIAKDLYERLGFKTHYTKMVLKINDNIYEN